MNYNTPTPIFTLLIAFLLCTLALSAQVASESSDVATNLYGTWVFKTEGSFEKIKPSVMTRLARGNEQLHQPKNGVFGRWKFRHPPCGRP